MPALPDPALWPLLANEGLAKHTSSEWSCLLNSSDVSTVPLSPVKGELAEFIRCPHTGVPLEIHENWNGSFSALPPTAALSDSRIDGLSVDDLRLFKVDWINLLESVRIPMKLAGNIRILSNKPPLWHIGTSPGTTFYFSIANSPTELSNILPFIQSVSSARLLLPSASDNSFAELTRQGIAFHLLDSSDPQEIKIPDPGAHSRYRINEQPGGWKIVFDGEDASVVNLKGLALVAYLLKHPPTAPIHILELESKVFPSPTFDTNPVDADTEADFETLGLSISERLKEFNLNKDNAETEDALRTLLFGLKSRLSDPDTDDTARAIAEKTIAEIEIFLAGGVPKHTDQASKAYERVRQQILRLLKKLREPIRKTGKPSPVLVAFAEHIEEHLIKPSRRYSRNRQSRVKAGVAQTLTYEPPPGITWTD